MTTEGNPTVELNPTAAEERKVKVEYRGNSSEAVYGLGLIGAWVYYISRASTFQEGVLGFLKGFVWPAFMVYALLKFLDKE
jgi:hypothetical protein